MEIQLQLTARDPVPTLSQSKRTQSVPTEPRAIREGTPVAPRSLVQKSCTWAKVITGGKKRKVVEEEILGNGSEEKDVGRVPDPEENRGKGVPMMVKVGGVRWGDGIGRVVEGLKEAEFVSCEGGRWLVDEGEWEKRMKQGRKSSMVVVRICGRDKVGELYHTSLWVSGVWCLVRRFVAVPVKRKEAGWVRVVEKVDKRIGGVEESVAEAVVRVGERVADVEKNVVEVAKELGDQLGEIEKKVMEEVANWMKVLGDGMGLLRKEIMEKLEKLEEERLVQMQIKVVLAGSSRYGQRVG
ncbi:hypothetical protein L873DRAFT_1286600 [Choiromyces venosus 120613-1]|uniref:Uncharacterized protein n=1 Tax=Choiromyces venosus 120613-1 TaxID=1336337 RepID=A0A3N4JCF1_9PEZI|nr:hypothetical protein L873DRAFT_1286600 [Choiromyces venosus 120613-1]